jgi:hypothetical protein
MVSDHNNHNKLISRQPATHSKAIGKLSFMGMIVVYILGSWWCRGLFLFLFFATTSLQTGATSERNIYIPRACVPPHDHYPFCNASLPLSDRLDDLIGHLTLDEKPFLLTARESPKGNISRLGIPECTDARLTLGRSKPAIFSPSHRYVLLSFKMTGEEIVFMVSKRDALL